MATICQHCAKDPDLIALIEEVGAFAAQCTVCGAGPGRALEGEDPRLIATLRALVRKYFDEWEYNTHWGGDGLEALFFKENPILRFVPTGDEEKLEEAILPALTEGYEAAGMPISLFAGYSDGEQNRLLDAMANELDWRVSRLGQRAQRENAYRLEPEARVLLIPHVAELEAIVPTGTALYRSRIGFERRNYHALESRANEWAFEPYSGSSLGAPPPPLAAAGRMNRAGVAFFYAADDADTAIREVRPHPGHTVSLGEFHLTRALRVANFGQVSIAAYSQSDARLDEYWLLLSIDRLFGRPVRPEDRAAYVLPQLLADVIRQLEFDGVAFRSSMGAGLNYAFFNPSDLTFVEDSQRAVHIAGLSYEYHPLRRLTQDN